ncbi:diaminopimelate decarboxylase [Actinoallomurus liliacearum]|uniref:Diaminopimelate decarboxylase n=1 Tax=Actinoallomurus liliacearum TaxID=1080073 RepID=A0ABP8TMH6_9ACTN
MDERDVRQRCRDFRRAFPDAEIAYAGKAFLCRAMARLIAEEGLTLDVCSAGELAVARSVRFPAERILMHGNGKTPEDLRAALSYGVSRIVVDCPSEITRVAALVGGDGPAQQVLIRVTPGVDGRTHPAVATGGEDQEFGFSLTSGAAAEAVRRVLAQPGLVLAGLHCHLGSQITRVAAYQQAARRMVDLLAAVRDEHGLALPRLDLGGGFAVPYLRDQQGLDPLALAVPLITELGSACDAHRFPMPRVTLEPGRAISARAGVTLYRVLGIKHTATGRVFVTVNGGMSDNPRPSLYGARYSIRLVGRRPVPGHRSVTVAGRHCEAGDVLVEDVQLPADLRPGDLLAIACTGAYHHSMASDYNLVPRPPVVAVRGGESRLLIRRETEADLLCRDVG